jgi:hypothetical protein
VTKKTGPAGERPSILDEHRERIIEMKLAGASARQIADNLGVDHSNLNTYLKRPSMVKEIDQQHGELMKRASRQLALGATWAVQTILYFVNPENRDELPWQARLQAAKIMTETIGLGRIADAAELMGVSFTEQAATSARDKAAAIEATLSEVAPGLRAVE